MYSPQFPPSSLVFISILCSYTIYKMDTADPTQQNTLILNSVIIKINLALAASIIN